MARPSVFAYLDHRAFLADWLAARREEDPAYSLAVFARDGGCSRTALANVIRGDRVPRRDTLEAFNRAMELSSAESGFLKLLVQLAAAPSVDARREVMARILATERYSQVRAAEREPEQDLARYLEHWSVPAIRELAGLPGFRADPEWLATQLRPAVAPARAARSLATLLDLGFLQPGSDGELRQREIRFRTAPESDQRAVARFHREEVPAMLQALDTRQAEAQHLITATITLDPAHLAEAKTRLNNVFAQIADISDEGSGSGPRRVYQLAVQLVPLTGPEEPDPT